MVFPDPFTCVRETCSKVSKAQFVFLQTEFLLSLEGNDRTLGFSNSSFFPDIKSKAEKQNFQTAEEYMSVYVCKMLKSKIKTKDH